MSLKMRAIDVGSVFWYMADHLLWLLLPLFLGFVWHRLAPNKRLTIKTLGIVLSFTAALSFPAFLVLTYVGVWPGILFALLSSWLYTYRGFRSRGRYGKSFLSIVADWAFERLGQKNP